MTPAFETLWRLSRQGVPAPRLRGEEPRGTGAFDDGTAVGQIRLLADTSRPLIVLLLADRGRLGWRVVPLSPFAVPASAREFAWGGHVFQLWNTCTLARRLVARSWLVDAVPPDVRDELEAACSAARPGRLTADEGVQARYEREFLIAGGTLRPWGVSRVTAPRRFRPAAELLKLAASFVICVGVFSLLLGPGRRHLAEWRSFCLARPSADDAGMIELVETAVPNEPRITLLDAEPALPFPELPPFPALPSPDRLPSAVARGSGLRPSVPDASSLALFGPVRLPQGDRQIDPVELPLSVLDLAEIRPLASDAGASGVGRLPVGGPPAVTCRVVESPWDPLAVLLNVRAEAAAEGLVEVFFERAKVRGYRLIAGAGTRPLNAYYEVALKAAGAEDPTRLGQVTLRWSVGCDEMRLIVPILRAELADLTELPTDPHAHGPAPSFVTPQDVPVESGL